MKTNRISLSYKHLCCLVGSTQIFDRLCAQQGAYMNAQKLKECPVSPEVLREYAIRCCDAFTRQLTKCQTDEDYQNLYEAYLERTARDGLDFLTANNMEAV